MSSPRHRNDAVSPVAELPASSPEISDRILVTKTLAGDAEAFAVLHRRYYARVYRYALYRCRNTQDAEDVAGETFIRAIRHLPSFRFQGDSIFPWLARISANLLADQGRRARGTTFLSLNDSRAGQTTGDLQDFIERLPSDGPDPHLLAERRETQALLRAAIGALPPDQGEAVLLRFGGDLSLKEIASTLGKTEGAVKSLLHRALANLRRSLSTGEQEAAVFGHTSSQQATRGNEPQEAAFVRQRYGTHIELDD